MKLNFFTPVNSYEQKKRYGKKAVFIISSQNCYTAVLFQLPFFKCHIKCLDKVNSVCIGIRCGRVVSVGDFETRCPRFDPQSRHYGHGGVPLGKAYFLA